MFICKHDDDVVIRKFHGEVILVPIRTAIADIDLLYTVNGNASFIWQFLDGSNDLEGVHQQMYCEFDIDPLEAKSVLEEVDEFYDGELGPLAIQGFLRFSYTDWTTPKPVYLVSFGDGHFDNFNNYATNETNLIPAFLSDVDPLQGEVAADNLPDLLAGRLPVRTTAEAAAVVQKIMNYETTEPVGWNEALTFVADNADDAGQYATDTDTMISTYVPVDYSAEKIYFGITHTTAPAVIRALLVPSIAAG